MEFFEPFGTRQRTPEVLASAPFSRGQKAPASVLARSSLFLPRPCNLGEVNLQTENLGWHTDGWGSGFLGSNESLQGTPQSQSVQALCASIERAYSGEVTCSRPVRFQQMLDQ